MCTDIRATSTGRMVLAHEAVRHLSCAPDRLVLLSADVETIVHTHELVRLNSNISLVVNVHVFLCT